MPILRGIDLRVALQMAPTWGTVADAAADDLFPCDAHSVRSVTNRVANEELNDTPMRPEGIVGLETVEGSITRKLHYQGDEVPLAAMAGTAGAPSQVGTTSYYTHELTANTELQGTFLSAFFDHEVSTYEVDSAKVVGVTITGAAGGYIMAEYQLLGRDLDIAGDLTWGSVTENTNARLNYLTFGQGYFWINTEGGGELSGSDVYYPSQFSFTWANNLEGFTTSRNHPNIDEPIRNAQIDVTGSFTFPIYDANTDVTRILSQAALKGELGFTSGSYSFIIHVPKFVWTGDVPVVAGPGRQELVLNWVGEKAESNPTGMSSTMPYFEVVNQLSTDPLSTS